MWSRPPTPIGLGARRRVPVTQLANARSGPPSGSGPNEVCFSILNCLLGQDNFPGRTLRLSLTTDPSGERKKGGNTHRELPAGEDAEGGEKKFLKSRGDDSRVVFTRALRGLQGQRNVPWPPSSSFSPNRMPCSSCLRRQRYSSRAEDDGRWCDVPKGNACHSGEGWGDSA